MDRWIGRRKSLRVLYFTLNRDLFISFERERREKLLFIIIIIIIINNTIIYDLEKKNEKKNHDRCNLLKKRTKRKKKNKKMWEKYIEKEKDKEEEEEEENKKGIVLEGAIIQDFLMYIAAKVYKTTIFPFYISMCVPIPLHARIHICTRT